MKEKLLQIEGLSVGYDGKTVLQDVDLTVCSHDFLGIIGPNGGGKTTLVKAVLGLVEKQSGSIRFFRGGEECGKITMGYLPQYSSLDRKFPISVEEVLLSGLSGQKGLWGRFTSRQHELVGEMVERMGLQGLKKRPVEQLSGGQLQRVLLGRALISKPALLILDEPDTYIDRRFGNRLYDLLDKISRECAIILVSHDVEMLLQHAKSVAFVNGTLRFHGGTDIPASWLDEESSPLE